MVRSLRMLTAKELQIATPCDVDWSKMTKREATRRFCGECKKHVNDLSLMTEDEARALLQSSATDGLCIRYLADDRGHIAFLPDVPVSSLTRMKRAALAAMTLAAPLSLAACMGAAPMPEPQHTMGVLPGPGIAPSSSADPYALGIPASSGAPSAAPVTSNQIPDAQKPPSLPLKTNQTKEPLQKAF